MNRNHKRPEYSFWNFFGRQGARRPVAPLRQHGFCKIFVLGCARRSWAEASHLAYTQKTFEKEEKQ